METMRALIFEVKKVLEGHPAGQGEGPGSRHLPVCLQLLTEGGGGPAPTLEASALQVCLGGRLCWDKGRRALKREMPAIGLLLGS